MSRKGICRLSVFRLAVAAPALPPATAAAAAPFAAPPLAVVCGFLLGGVVSSSSSSLSDPELLELEPDEDELVSELELLDDVEGAFFSSLRLAAVGTGVALAEALVGRSSGTGAAAGVAAVASAGLLMPLLMCSAAFLAACRWGTYAKMSRLASSFEEGAVDGAGVGFSTSTSRSLDGGAALSFSLVGGAFSRCLVSFSAGRSFSATEVVAAAAAVGLGASG